MDLGRENYLQLTIYMDINNFFTKLNHKISFCILILFNIKNKKIITLYL